jgi:predicted PurR-regulated permease PerM
MSNNKSAINEKKFGEYFLLASVAVVSILFLYMIRALIMPAVLAVVIAIMVYPLYRLTLRLTRNKKILSSLICCTVVLLALLVPLAFLMNLLLKQSVELYHTAGPQVEDLLSKIQGGSLGRLLDSITGRFFERHGITVDLKPVLSHVMERLGNLVPVVLNSLSKATGDLTFYSFVIIFSLFYFLIDGKMIMERIKELIPISSKYKEEIIVRFRSMSDAIMKGIFLMSLAHATFVALIMLAFGFKAWLLLGIIAFILAILPVGGSGFILIPAGIIRIAAGNVFQGILILVVSGIVMALIDNVLRPKIIGRDVGMHDLLVLFSIVGGIFTFGGAGMVIGPLIAAVFLSIIGIYRVEFQPHIDHPDVHN